ncbi:MAG: thiamine pyrophosphate-dependent enzyme [Gemmatimonadota bacterium]|nr:thiamine pyrophosphate-dependent enzyme [Gemmatimonadota bacterium]
MSALQHATTQQERRNRTLLDGSRYLSDVVTSEVLPIHIDVRRTEALTETQNDALIALQIDAARTAVRSLASLAGIGEADHLGGGIGLIPPLLLTLAVVDFERIEYTIEHAHTSVGYYAALSAVGFVDPDHVVTGFRRGLDLPGHVSWLPGGTQMNGGRLGVMIPVAVGNALGKRGTYGDGCWVVAHCGDAGWISGQALNGFNAAHVHGAPITFVMDRNGIQLSGSTRSILDKDPRTIIGAMGVEILEIPTLHDPVGLYRAYREAYGLAQGGRPSLIYPVGFRSGSGKRIDLSQFGQDLGIFEEVEAFAGRHDVPVDREIWVPGSLMSYRDVEPMLECLFLVNDLPGGAGHHDGGMKDRNEADVLANPMFRSTPGQSKALDILKSRSARKVLTRARPAPGSPNLVLPDGAVENVSLPGPGEMKSARDGSEAGYALVAETFPDRVFVVSCDLDASTKLSKARSHLAENHQFEISIEEQAATLIANGLATSTPNPQLNVVSTFAAFFEGIAREGFDMWQYQRNLTGANEGLNVTFHLSHVGACTGRDHFSGWGLDWINVGLNYLPYLHRFYAPADARSAFLAVIDLAANYGGHIIAIPRDNLPVLEKQDGSGPLWAAADEWQPVTRLRSFAGARRAILAFGAPAFLAAEAADALNDRGVRTDVFVVNGLPLPDGRLETLVSQYARGVVTIEDGKIGTPQTGLRGFAGLVATAASSRNVAHAHVGLTVPTVAPSDGHMETWAHFGITTDALVDAVDRL